LRGDAGPLKFLDALHIALKYFAVVGDYSEWHAYIFAILPYLGSLNGLRVVNEFIDDQIHRRLQKVQEKAPLTDMMDDFLPYAYGDPDPKKAFESMRHLCETNILPGADTSAIAICATIFYLNCNPECLRKLRAELNTVRERQTQFSDQVDPGISPYFEAVVKEAMRLHPPIGLMNPRVIPEGGAPVGGHYFAGGVRIHMVDTVILLIMIQSIVGVNSFILHHNFNVWGEDHDEFRPERWLGEDRARLDRAFFGVSQTLPPDPLLR
jgi:cytochrome P450